MEDPASGEDSGHTDSDGSVGSVNMMSCELIILIQGVSSEASPLLIHTRSIACVNTLTLSSGTKIANFDRAQHVHVQ